MITKLGVGDFSVTIQGSSCMGMLEGLEPVEGIRHRIAGDMTGVLVPWNIRTHC